MGKKSGTPACRSLHGHAQSSPEIVIRSGCGLMGFHDNNEVFVVIEYFGGFEYFNTRPYHNYEQWGHGFRVTIRGMGASGAYTKTLMHMFDEPIVATDECLDCALAKAMGLAHDKRKELEEE